jgi:hypothetical protein
MTMRVLRRNGVDCQSWGVHSVEQLFHRIEQDEWSSGRPISHIVINTPNFATPDEIAELANRWPDIEFAMLNHTGQSYFCIDQDGVQKIRDLLHLQRAMHNVKVAGNNSRFGWFENYGVKPIWLPNLYDCDTFVQHVGHRPIHDPLRVGTFGENRPWKNQGVAAMAAISMAKRLGVNLELFVNADRWQQTWQLSKSREQLIQGMPGMRIVVVPWQSWAKFRQTVGTMDICLHPSFDETFCVVVADGIAEGVPSVVTSAMEWAPRSWMAADPHDPASVAAIGLSLLHSRASAIHDGRRALIDFTDRGIALWVRYLTQ